MTKLRSVCPNCRHLLEEDVEHVCPTAEETAMLNRLIHEAAETEEMFGIEELEYFAMHTAPTHETSGTPAGHVTNN